jgi:acetylornithine deacetylase/succinyl-diaminopimelate desuccinylase-like protein
MTLNQATGLEEIYDHIDAHIDAHIERMKELCRIPSIAAEDPASTRRCAELMKRWYDELGCIETEVVETKGSPVVYAHYDAGAKNTVLVYMMYDVKQVSGESWTMVKDPFDPKIMPMAPFEQVMVGRGTNNSKGPMTVFMNALYSIRSTGNELPVNLRFIAEGEEELGSVHLAGFVEEHRGWFEDADIAFGAAGSSSSQNILGVPVVYLGCKGVSEVEIECSGEHWGRGPTTRGIHSSLAAVVESPLWRLVQALSTMVDPSDPSRVTIEGFYDNVAEPTKRDLSLVEDLDRVFDVRSWTQANDVKHFVHDLEGKELLKKALYTTTLNIQGIYGGYTGPKGKTVLPHSARAKLESRLIPDMTQGETVEKIRRHLDAHGYRDIKIVYTSGEHGDDWSRTNPDAGCVQVMVDAYKGWGYTPQVWPFSLGTSPQYIWTKILKIPYITGGLGHGGRAHAPDEFQVIEGDGKKGGVAGMAEAEKFAVFNLFRMRDAKLG